jgi:ribose transport system permease protein
MDLALTRVRRLAMSGIARAPYSSAAVAAGIVLVIITIKISPGFISRGGWQLAVNSAAPFIVLAMAEAPAVLSGRAGLDLSVGPAAGLIAVLLAGFVVPAGLSDPWTVIPIAIALGCASGLFNGILVAFGRVPPIIATLATYLIYAGIATNLLPAPGGIVPNWLQGLASTTGPFPNMLIVFIAIGAFWLLLMRTSYGRNLFAVGGNDRAAFTAGVNVRAVRVLAYMFGGILTGIAGLVLMVVLGGADANAGPPYTLIAVASVALGGVSLAGGRGGLLGPAAGGATLFLVQNDLSFVRADAFTLDIAYGVVVIVAIVMDAAWDTQRRRWHEQTLLVAER